MGKTADTDWMGDPIVVDLSPAGVGGLEIRSDARLTRVVATATFVAMADTFDKASADASISAAKATFQVGSVGGKTTVTCRNGTDNGSSKALDSGCEKVVVSVPVGDPKKPVRITARVPRGALTVLVADAWVLEANLTAAEGDVDALLPVVPGAVVSVTSESAGNVVVRLPASFAADKVTLDAPSGGTVDTAAFAGLASGGGRGAAGTGFASLSVLSKPRDGKAGHVYVVPQ